MSYQIQGRDLVIAGFADGIADSPHDGIGDMRNIDLISIPGEASVEFSETPATAPPVLNAVAYTAATGTNRLTWANTTPLYQGLAITLASNTAGGLSNGVVYYVISIVGATFQLALAPGAGGAPITITGNGAGTFTTYQYGKQRGVGSNAPVSYYVDRFGTVAGVPGILIADASNYLWLLLSTSSNLVPANTLVFLGNIGGIAGGASSTSGVTIWNGYIFLIGANPAGTDIAKISVLFNTSAVTAWTYTWKTLASFAAFNGHVDVLVSQADGRLYYTSTTGVGNIIQQPNKVFDPTDVTTYAINDSALLIPTDDKTTCLAELGATLLIGGIGSFIYTWDKISLGFSGLLNIPEITTYNIVATSQNAYVFSGIRGRIYITNGSGIDLYKKLPDYVTGGVTPYIIWQDASFGRNQLYFSFLAQNNSGTVLNTVSGCWALDLDNDAFRFQNKTTNTGYTSTTTMVTEMPSYNPFDNPAPPAGTSMVMGWYNGSVYGVDVGSSNPYSNYESYLDTDIIPVGTFLDNFTPSQVEYKLAAPLVSGESVRMSYRTDISTAFALIEDPSHPTGVSNTVGNVADVYQTNFMQAQWVQLRVELASTNTTPSYVRLKEVRIRDYPSGNQAEGSLPVKI